MNNKIMELNADLGTVGVVCECCDPQCAALLRMTAVAYEALRRSPLIFAVASDHVDNTIERVVATFPEYWLVEVTAPRAIAVLKDIVYNVMLDPVSQGTHADDASASA